MCLKKIWEIDQKSVHTVTLNSFIKKKWEVRYHDIMKVITVKVKADTIVKKRCK